MPPSPCGAGRRACPSRRPRRLFQVELAQLVPAWVGRALVDVLRTDLVEIGAAHRAQAGAVVLADDLRGKREHQGVTGPGVQVEAIAVDVRARELGIAGPAVVNLARVDVRL